MPTIRELRDERGWTQTELAERIGVSRTTVMYWETGRRGITGSQLQAMARELNVSMDDIELPDVKRKDDE